MGVNSAGDTGRLRLPYCFRVFCFSNSHIIPILLWTNHLCITKRKGTHESLQEILASRSTVRLLIRATSPTHYHTWCDVAQQTGGAVEDKDFLERLCLPLRLS
ncbi:hypothetical protein Y032_0538g3142 [Ancylostoma ceylanicum]|uniref:Uncharacterized protein n=1 Tax=Ancylostoma ceylanicum TaxID=53326 RepID=A0A016WRG7_9BILA|nr:hypothetical protein Y032_0538g3142 [Ancylostoma ceylanicum]